MNKVKRYEYYEPYVSAIQFDGHNDAAIEAFVETNGYDPVARRPGWVISTPYGDVFAEVGDWIVSHPDGSFTVMKDKTFNQSFCRA